RLDETEVSSGHELVAAKRPPATRADRSRDDVDHVFGRLDERLLFARQRRPGRSARHPSPPCSAHSCARTRIESCKESMLFVGGDELAAEAKFHRPAAKVEEKRQKTSHSGAGFPRSTPTLDWRWYDFWSIAKSRLEVPSRGRRHRFGGRAEGVFQ